MKLHVRMAVRNATSEEAAKAAAEAKKDTAKKVVAEKNLKCLIPGHPLQTIFSDVRLRLNDTLVTSAPNHYPIVANHLMKTCVPPLFRDFMKIAGRGYNHDNEDLTFAEATDGKGGEKVDFTTARWEDLDIRRSWCALDRKDSLDFSTYLICDINMATMPLILPDTVSLGVELVLNEPKKAIISDRVGLPYINPVVEISEARLSIPLHTPRVGLPKSIKHQFFAVKVQPIILAKGSSHHFGLASYMKVLPSRVSLLFLKMTTYDGDGKSSMFTSQPCNLESAVLYRGGIPHPSLAVTATFSKSLMSEMWLRTHESLRLSLARTGVKLPTLAQYRDDSFIWSCDMSSDYSCCNSKWVTPPSDGSLSISLNFRKPLIEQTICLVLFEVLNTLTIDSHGLAKIT